MAKIVKKNGLLISKFFIVSDSPFVMKIRWNWRAAVFRIPVGMRRQPIRRFDRQSSLGSQSRTWGYRFQNPRSQGTRRSSVFFANSKIAIPFERFFGPISIVSTPQALMFTRSENSLVHGLTELKTEKQIKLCNVASNGATKEPRCKVKFLSML